MNLDKYTDDDLFEAAGLQTAPDASAYSDDDLFAAAGVNPETRESLVTEPDNFEQQYIDAGIEPPRREFISQSESPNISLPEAFKMGRAQSIPGKLIGLEQKEFGMKPTVTQRAASTFGQLSHDIPFYMLGSILGAPGAVGATVLGTAGAFALPAGVHKVLDDRGKDELGEKFIGAMKETGKGWLTGLATGTVGKFLPKGTKFVGEAATLATVPALLEQQLPTGENLVDAFILLGLFKGSRYVGTKLNKGITEMGLNKEGAYAKLHKEISDHIFETNSADMTKAEADYVADILIKKAAGDMDVENMTVKDLWGGIKNAREIIKGRTEPTEAEADLEDII